MSPSPGAVEIPRLRSWEKEYLGKEGEKKTEWKTRPFATALKQSTKRRRGRRLSFFVTGKRRGASSSEEKGERG